VASVTPNLTTIVDANVGSQTFTLTVVYSEAMNTSVNPTLVFPTASEDPTASPATLTLNSGSWTNATTFVATYNVTDQDATMPDVDVQVSGAKDAAGNTQVGSTLADKFSIDMALAAVNNWV
jgi:large repetitive protein